MAEVPTYFAERMNRRDELTAREKRRRAGVRRREKVTGKKVGYFGQGLGAHRKSGRKNRNVAHGS